jgi:hypothetical protein
MNERATGLYTRRSVLGMAIGLLAAGCATASDPARPTLSGTRAGRFPDPSEWCWPNTRSKLDEFGQLIMQGRNPYCVRPGMPSSPCDPNDPATWPQELTDEATWKVLTEFDFQTAVGTAQDPAPPWQFGSGTVLPSRSMRIPYLIGHSRAKKERHVPGRPVPPSFGRENLLIGYQSNPNTFAGATLWDGPNTCTGNSATKTSVGRLAEFITVNMTFDASHTESFYIPNTWNVEGSGWPNFESGGENKKWYFRRAPIVVDYVFRVPIATGSGGVARQAGWIYIGYEGGGAY